MLPYPAARLGRGRHGEQHTRQVPMQLRCQVVRRRHTGLSQQALVEQISLLMRTSQLPQFQ